VVSVTGLAFFRLHYVVISVIRLSHSLVSEYANQHILSLSQPRNRDGCGRKGISVNISWIAWLGLLSLSSVWLLQAS